MKKLKQYPFLHTFNPIQKINATTIVERLSRKPHQLFQPHLTDFYMIYLFTDGTGIHSVDFNDVEVIPGNILFMSKGQVHHFDPLETYDGKTIVFTEDFFCRSEAHRSFLNRTALFNDPLRLAYFDSGVHYNVFTTLYQFIVDELKNVPDENQTEILHNYLFNVLLTAERLYNPTEKNRLPSRNQLLVYDFKRLVNKNLFNHYTIEQYAALLNVTTRSLQGAFAESENKTPKGWLTERLVLEIKRTLTYETMSVSEVALLYGL
ncbi:helix-turn-helix domain-containing protein [Chryseobacterium pennipullorum]|uniref:AraC family transcriptional regulator n=1 Tax=Chryseobacterium pennipullorum TaxID=2258963 RepID=A0A3D9AMY8_9FLAO|nr:AraC family ligand binding domain-containing protein [Chryseobacterium pennipullorum]REC42681.1 AraC family transcriptional regulator [Chryseobacterium pennipullorum]